MNEKVVNLIKQTFNEKKNSHAFLMETNDLEKCLNEVLNLIFDLNNISREILLDNIVDLKVVYPDGKEIKKDQLVAVIDDFQTFPVELMHRYYIVVGSELMNPSSANVILKFLEEPNNAIIGFFITINKSAMINTIVSRCQCYKFNYSDRINYDENKISDFLENMKFKELYKRIYFLNDFFDKDRNTNILKIKEIKNYLSNFSDIKNIKLLVKRVSLLDNVIEKLLKNANQELVILDLARNWK